MKKVYKIFFIHTTGVPMDLLWYSYQTYEDAEAEVKKEITKNGANQVFVILPVYIKE